MTLSADAAQVSSLGPFPLDTVVEDGEWGSSSTGSAAEIAVAGLYSVHGHGHRLGGLNSSLTVGILVNGALVAATTADASSGERWSSASFLDELVVGDVVELAVAGTSAAAKLTVVGTALQLARVGPVRWT